MKYFLILFTLLCIGCTNSIDNNKSDQLFQEMEQMVETQNYFKLKKTFEKHKHQLSKSQSLYIESIYLNVFNKLKKSNSAIEKLLISKDSSITDSMLNKLYHTKLLNHINLYEYNEAKNTSNYILKNYLHLNDSSNINMLENELKIWDALKNIPKQEVYINSDITIPLIKDKVGYPNIDVLINNQTKNYVFDTGANFSVVKRSLVKELNLKYFDAGFFVTAATGLKVKSDVAVADTLKIGDLVYKNVVFLVLDDEDISFPQIDYYINGIIGFPIIEAMKEIRYLRGNSILIPSNPSNYSNNNFALNGLMPIIAVEHEQDTLLFNFDTGARKTDLYYKFYVDYKEDLDKKFTKEKFKSSSVGGEVEFEGFIIDEIKFTVGKKTSILKNIQLHSKSIGTSKNNIHGNLGQDFIKQYDEMIISFLYSSILFK